MSAQAQETEVSSGSAGRGLVRRMGWGVADQAVSSLGNFIVGAYAAKYLGAAALGAFALAFAAYAVILNGARGLSTDPLVVRYSGSPAPVWHRATSSAAGASLVIGAAAGVLCAGIGLALVGLLASTEVGFAFVALGVGLPMLMLLDSWRNAFFAAHQPEKALIVDVSWTGLLTSGLLLLYVSGHGSVAWLLLVWGGTAGIAALVGAVLARVIPAPVRSRVWLKEHRFLNQRYVVENVIAAIAGNARSFVLAATAGLAATGQLRAVEMIFGPFLVIFMGVGQVAVPEARRWLRHGTRTLLWRCAGMGAVLATLALLFGVLAWMTLPLGLGTVLLGSVWLGAHALIPGATVGAMAGGTMAPGSAGLRALGRADRSLHAQLLITVLTVTGGSVGALVGQASGAVWGSSLAAIASACVWWFHLRRACREHGTQRDRSLT